MYSRIAGTGRYLPERMLTNFDLEKMVETTDQWIRERTGIERRHIAADGKDGAGLLVSLAGVVTVGQFDQLVRIGPGHAYPMTNAEPFALEHGHDGRPIMFNFGSEVLSRRLFDQGAPDRAIDLRVGIGRTVLALVTSLIEDAGARAWPCSAGRWSWCSTSARAAWRCASATTSPRP
jgi:hypothetical protein